MSDFSDLTVPQLRARAKEQGYGSLSGLRKAELIAYLQGRAATIEKSDYPPRVFTEEDIEPRYADTSIPWTEHFDRYGWAVAPIPNWSPSYRDHFFAWLRDCCPEFNPDDPTTWTRERLPLSTRGIIKQHLGHTDFQWSLRESCSQLYSQFYSIAPNELLVSFDGGYFLPAPRRKSKFKCSIHNDTPRGYESRRVAQGIVNMTANGPNDGGTLLLENSHRELDEYMTRHPSAGLTWELADLTDPLLHKCTPIKICAPEGSLILFDGRTLHSAIPPFQRSLSYRMALYVSCQPRSWATTEELIRRVEWHYQGRMTGHWCVGPWLKTNSGVRTYGKTWPQPSKIIIQQCSESIAYGELRKNGSTPLQAWNLVRSGSLMSALIGYS